MKEKEKIRKKVEGKKDMKQEKLRKLKEFIFLLQHTYLDIKPFMVKCFSK